MVVQSLHKTKSDHLKYYIIFEDVISKTVEPIQTKNNS